MSSWAADMLVSSLHRFAPGDMPPLEHFRERLRSFKDFRSFQRPGYRLEMDVNGGITEVIDASDLFKAFFGRFPMDVRDISPFLGPVFEGFLMRFALSEVVQEPTGDPRQADPAGDP